MRTYTCTRTIGPVAIYFLLTLSAPHSLWSQQPQIVGYSTASNSSSPGAITVGPDGNLWFTDGATNAIGKITSGGTITEYPLATPKSLPVGIAAGPDGNLWFTEASNNKIARITPAGAITENGLPTAGAYPTYIVLGSDGNLWFLEYAVFNVAKVTPAGVVTEYPIRSNSFQFPSQIALGPDGNLWFGESGGYVGQATTAGAIQLFPALANTASNILSAIGISSITAGPDGAVWFIGAFDIWRMTTAGVTTLVYSVPTNNSQPAAITTGPDGALWLTENYANKVARITPAGQIAEYALPSDITAPNGIVQGPDGNIWFTAAGKICKLVLSTLPATAAPVLNPSSLSFNQTALASPPPAQTLSVAPSAGGPFTVSTSVIYSIGPSWLQITPSGSLSGLQTLTVNANGTPYGTYGAYFGDISIAAGGITVEIPVTMNVVKPAPPPTTGNISASPSALNFTYLTGTQPPAAQQIALTGASNGLIQVTISVTQGLSTSAAWLSLSNGQGASVSSGATVTTPAQLTATVNPAGLSPGTYSATIGLTPAGGSVVLVPVTLTISANTTAISLSQTSLSFVYQANPSNTIPPAQTVAVTVTGSTNTSFRVQELGGSGWLVMSSLSATAPASLTFTVLPLNMAPGVYTDSVNIYLPQSNPVVSATIEVFLTVEGAASPLTQFSAPSAAYGYLTSGPDGAIWFTEPNAGKIGRITTAGSITEFPAPNAGLLAGIASGPDGNIWFVEQAPGKIGKITTAGTVTEFTIPTVNSFATGISAGPDGNLWFTETGANKMARVTTNGNFTEYPLPNPSSAPAGITMGPDGNLWFAENRAGGKIGKITVNGVVTEYALPSAGLAYPQSIVAGADGNVWFTDQGASEVGKVTPAGVVTEYPSSAASGITLGSDGNIWVVGASLDNVAPNGNATAFSLYPVATYLFQISSGSDGSLWFTDLEGIGRYTLSAGSSNIAGIVNAASFQGGGVSPGEIVTIAGTNLGPTTPLGLTLDATGKVATSLGGVTVSFGGFAAPLLYVSASQINCIVPYELTGAGGAPSAQISYTGNLSFYPLTWAGAVPGIFTADGSGTGTAAILNSSGGYNGPQNPASQGSVITIYLTGEGQTNPSGITGAVTSANSSGSGPLTPQPVLPVSVTIGGASAPVTFFGEAPGLVAGLMQINAQVPTGINTGSLPLLVDVGGVASQGKVTISVK
jgi:uncharacterized protein (TIGR03437 family)